MSSATVNGYEPAAAVWTDAAAGDNGVMTTTDPAPRPQCGHRVSQGVARLGALQRVFGLGAFDVGRRHR